MIKRQRLRESTGREDFGWRKNSDAIARTARKNTLPR
jgi:hypothetical protein